MKGSLFQNFIDQMHVVLGCDVGVMDENGNIVACTVINRNGETVEEVMDIFQGETIYAVRRGVTYKVIKEKNKIEYIVFVCTEDAFSQKYCDILSVSLSNMKQYYDERYDKTNFIKNIILDNLLLGDVSVKAKELHLQLDVKRIAILVRTFSDDEIHVKDILENLFPGKNKDFVIAVDDCNFVLIKELKEDYNVETLQGICSGILDMLNTELMIKANIGIGTVVNHIKYLGKSYKEARIALEVGKVFDIEKNVIWYDHLGIGRLIYQLPTTLCDLFLSEVFKKGSIEALDEETVLTIQKFFENNLNVSETSRQLFVHRNTLVYRLDKIYKITGLDLRIFEHAIVFKVAMMVKKYLDANSIGM